MDMIKEIKIGVGLTVLFLGIVVFLVVRQAPKTQSVITSTPTPTRTVTPTTSGTSFSVSEVAKHSKATDCWYIVNSSVYNVTNYLYDHPGGASTMIPYCGQNATAYYKSISKHGARANADLASLLIGTVK